MAFKIEVTLSSVKMTSDGSLATSEPDSVAMTTFERLRLGLSLTPSPVMEL